MPTLSASQIAGYAQGAGFSGNSLTTAVAVALAESSGNTQARKLTTLEDSRGLWQINTYAHADWASKDLYDPAVNAAAAWEVSGHGSNFGPWSMFTNGTYQTFMADALRAAGNPSTGGAIVPASNSAVAISAADFTLNGPDTLKFLLNPWDSLQNAVVNGMKLWAEFFRLNLKGAVWISKGENWLRIAYVVGGVVLTIAGLVLVAKPLVTNVAASQVGSVVKKVVTT